MVKDDRLLTLKEAVIFSNHAEENIRIQIEHGNLKKYDINGNLLEEPLREKGFFRLSELMNVYGINDDPDVLKERFFIKKRSRDSVKNIIPARITILPSSQMNKLEQIENNSIDTWILAPPFEKDEIGIPISYYDVINSVPIKSTKEYLEKGKRILKKRSNLLIHSIPNYIPYFGVELLKLGHIFKYWIIYDIKEYGVNKSIKRFIPTSKSILFFVKTEKKFLINRVRESYLNCSFCKKPLKDYGGKKHLRHKDGMILSDIWHVDYDPNSMIHQYDIPIPILKRMIDLSCAKTSSLLLGPYDGEPPYEI